MEHKGTQTLTTKRLFLRPMTPSDAGEMYENWAKDERVTKYLTWPPHASPEKTKKVLEFWEEEYKKADFYQWGMVYEGKLIGSISVVRIDERSEWAELGYCMGYDYWGKGLMTEAARCVIDFLFSQVGVNRITIEHAVKNPASGKVAKKCGMTHEGTKREYFKSAWGEFLDISFWGILRKEWEAAKMQPPKGI